MRKGIMALMMFAGFGQKLIAQNLVPNPSFEIYDTCPNRSGGGQIYVAVPWFQPWTWVGGNVINSSSTDYYNSCSSFMGVPSNPEGFQYARSGNAYAGIFFYAHDETREYLEVMLTDSLIAGKKYCVEYFVSLAYDYTFATDNLHFYFSRDSLLKNTPGLTAIQVTPSVINSLGNYASDTLNWTKISGSYIANGGERFLTIGNFYDNAHTDTIRFRSGVPTSIYYFVDDVSVVDCEMSGISERQIPSSISLYPNPNSGMFTLYDNLRIQPYLFQLMDLTGRIIFSNYFSHATNKECLDVPGLSNGIYLWEIKTTTEILDNGKIEVIK